jgi:hypothetical protein
LAVSLLLVFGLAPVALAAPKGDPGPPTHGCDQALENDGDPYDSTCDGSPSENGEGDGNANGKPCAGCVGAADNKNPKGQMPNGSDANNGYECDGNKGVGVGNPAHTSCDAYAGTASAKAAKLKGTSKTRAVDFDVPSGGISGKVAMILALVLAAGVFTTFIVSTRPRKVRGDES